MEVFKKTLLPKIWENNAILDWSNTVDYSIGSLVKLNGGGALYRALAPSGPNQSSGPQSPETDDGTYWINESNIVHRFGDETITGIKTLTNPNEINSAGYISTELPLCIPGVDLINDTSIQSDYHFASIEFTDKNGFGDNHNIAYINANQPTTSDSSFTLSLCLRPISSYAGTTYGTRTGIWMHECPNGCAYIDTYNLMIHGSYPLQTFRSTSAPNKGTYPTSNKYESIYFMDNAQGESWADQTHRYAELTVGISKNKSISLRQVLYKNVADSTDSFFIESIYNAANDTKNFQASLDNQVDLGSSGYRWKQLYAGTTTISTSDARLKTDTTLIPDNILDAWGNIDFVQFKMLDSVKEKGSAARFHSGLIAQSIDQAFKANNLDASKYGLFCYDEWDAQPEEIDENGGRIREAQPAGNQYSLRYEEALCMEAAYQRRENRRLKDRVSELETKLLQLEEKLNQIKL